MGEDERKLYVANLPWDIAEDELQEVFGLYGNVTEVHVNFPKDNRPVRSAFVRFEESEDAAAAMAVLSDMYKFREDQGPVRVNVARPAGYFNGGWAAGGKGETHGASYGSNGDITTGTDAFWAGAAGAGTDAANAAVVPPPNAAVVPPPAAIPAAAHSVATPPPPAPVNPWATGGGVVVPPPPAAPAAAGSGSWGSTGPPQPPPSGGNSQREDGYAGAQANGRPNGFAGGYGNGKDPISGRDLGAKLWVGNLPSDATPDLLEKVFGAYGQVEEASILPNKSRSGQVCAFVHYATPTQADACLAAMSSGYELRSGEGELKVERPAARSKGTSGYPYGYAGGYNSTDFRGKGGKKGYQPY